MDSIDTWATFFGWCTILNMGIYALTAVSFLAFRARALKINARLFAIPEEAVAQETFAYMGRYKLATTVLCFVPYLALKLMA